MAHLPAHAVAVPVLERPAGAGRVLGAGGGAAWVDLDGFVVAVTARGVPLLPNALALAAPAATLAAAGLAAGAPARLGPGRLAAGGLTVTWDPAAPPAWDPAAPPAWEPSAPEAGAAAGRAAVAAAVRRRGEALLAALHATPPRGRPAAWPDAGRPAAWPDARGVLLGSAAVALWQALGHRDADRLAGAARGLLGRGGGLTPEGDDLLAGAAAALAVLGPATLGGPTLGPLLAAVTSAGARGRTTALAATLLELALAGRVAEPARVLLDLDPVGERAWPDALARLGRLGHSTGRAWAFGIGAAAALLGGGPPALDNPVLGGSVAAGIRRLRPHPGDDQRGDDHR